MDITPADNQPEELDLEEQAFEPDDVTPVAEPGSLLDVIHQRAEDNGQARFKVFDIPGYEGILAVRLKPVPWETIKKLGKKVKRMQGDEFDKLLPASADTIIEACDEVLAVVGDDTVSLKDVPEIASALDLTEDSPPVQFSETLYRLINPNEDGSTRLNAREVIYAVIPNETALTEFAEEFSEWQKSNDLGDGVPEKSGRPRFSS